MTRKTILLFFIMLLSLPLLADKIEEYNLQISRDTLINGDSAIVITTICAPICSSIARVYALDNKDWTLIRTLTGDPRLVFPEAYFEEQELRWKDNTPQMLDEEGR